MPPPTLAWGDERDALCLGPPKLLKVLISGPARMADAALVRPSRHRIEALVLFSQD